MPNSAIIAGVLHRQALVKAATPEVVRSSIEVMGPKNGMRIATLQTGRDCM